MPQTVTWAGTQYSVPNYQDTGWAQGSGNLTNYLVALPAGALQITGGNFTLTADTNFGATYGLVSTYFKSRSASISTAGVLRLASGDTIDWGVGNLALGVSGSSLVFNGSTVLTAGAEGNLTEATSSVLTIAGGTGAVIGSGTTIQVKQATTSVSGYLSSTDWTTFNNKVTSITGTAHQVIVGGTTTVPVLSTPQSIDTTSSPTFAALTLSSPLTVANGGTGIATTTAYAVLCGGTTATGAFQHVSGLGTSGQVLTSNGASALPTWVNSSSGAVINSGTQYQLAYYAANGTTLSPVTNTVAATQVLVTDSNGVPTTTGNGSTSATEIGYVHGVTSAIQTQLGTKFDTAGTGLSSSGTTVSLSAVTQVQASVASNSFDLPQTITTQAITTTGGTVLIYAVASIANGGGITVCVTRGGTAITGGTQGNEGQSGATFPIICVDTPSAGTYTYNFTCTGSSTVSKYSLVLVELKH
jgi:trimeric autotransporter adhesin